MTAVTDETFVPFTETDMAIIVSADAAMNPTSMMLNDWKPDEMNGGAAVSTVVFGRLHPASTKTVMIDRMCFIGMWNKKTERLQSSLG
jgi:hypothetical protein